MKKIYYLFTLFTVALSLTSCLHEEEDLFGDSSANRADAAIAEYTKVLTEQGSSGWIMEYFPADGAYGGYTVLMSFDANGNVTVASDITDEHPDSVFTSYYKMKQSAGIVLSFDTYNDIFHYFSDPADPSGLGGSGYGMEGDYDFLIVKATPDSVILKGKKGGTYSTLLPMKNNWTDYIKSVQDMQAATVFPAVQLEIGGEIYPITKSSRTLSFSYVNTAGEAVSVTMPYIVTPTGYKLYKPIDVNGTILKAFTYDVVNNIFTEESNSSVLLRPIVPPLNQQFVTGQWFFAYSELGPWTQTYFAATNAKLTSAAVGEEMQYGFVGANFYPNYFGFNFNSSGYTGSLGLDYTLEGENKVTLVFNFTGMGDGVWYHNNADFHYILNTLGYNSARTFTLSTDNLNNPSWILMTEDANQNNWLRLYAAPVYYPFDN
jgi:hypothetical protein